MNLASALITRYRHTRERHNADEAIIVVRPPASNGGLTQLEILASALLLRVDRDGRSDALDEAIDLLRQCHATSAREADTRRIRRMPSAVPGRTVAH